MEPPRHTGHLTIIRVVAVELRLLVHHHGIHVEAQAVIVPPARPFFLGGSSAGWR